MRANWQRNLELRKLLYFGQGRQRGDTAIACATQARRTIRKLAQSPQFVCFQRGQLSCCGPSTREQPMESSAHKRIARAGGINSLERRGRRFDAVPLITEESAQWAARDDHQLRSLSKQALSQRTQTPGILWNKRLLEIGIKIVGFLSTQFEQIHPVRYLCQQGTQFFLRAPERRARIHIKRGEKFQPSCCIQSRQSGRASWLAGKQDRTSMTERDIFPGRQSQITRGQQRIRRSLTIKRKLALPLLLERHQRERGIPLRCSTNRTRIHPILLQNAQEQASKTIFTQLTGKARRSAQPRQRHRCVSHRTAWMRLIRE